MHYFISRQVSKIFKYINYINAQATRKTGWKLNIKRDK